MGSALRSPPLCQDFAPVLFHPPQLAAVAMAAQCQHVSTGRGSAITIQTLPSPEPLTELCPVSRESRSPSACPARGALWSRAGEGSGHPRGVPIPTAAASGSRVVLAERGLPRPPARGCLCGTRSFLPHWDPSQGQGGGDSHLPASPRETFTWLPDPCELQEGQLALPTAPTQAGTAEQRCWMPSSLQGSHPWHPLQWLADPRKVASWQDAPFPLSRYGFTTRSRDV